MSYGVDVTATIGRTPLVTLARVVAPSTARVYVKLESRNPTGSMKDRMAVSVIEGALRSGRLQPDGTVVEYTGGSTGTSLALVCAARGIGVRLVTSDAFSIEKRDQMRALGAEVIEIPSDGGQITKELIQAMMARAEELASAPDAFHADQFHNTDAAPGYAPLAEEIWEQTEGKVDAFVQSAGTGHCIAGVARALKKRNPAIRIVAVGHCAADAHHPHQSPKRHVANGSVKSRQFVDVMGGSGGRSRLRS